MSLRAAARFAALSPRRRILVVAAALLTVVLLAVGGVRAGQILGKRTAAPGSPSRPRAVILVPGYGGNTHSLDALARRIQATGRPAVIVQLPSGGTGDLQVQAGVLNTYVQRALRSGSPPVDVIGYSAGGVVAWLWDAGYGGARSARRIITLGSPLHGAQLAAAGAAFLPELCPAACQQLAPGSALLTRLQRAGFTGRPAWLSLWTQDDLVVQPPNSARLPGALNVPLQSVCPDAVIEHSELPSDPLVVGIVLRALSSATLTPPSAADCRQLRALGGQPAVPAGRE